MIIPPIKFKPQPDENINKKLEELNLAIASYNKMDVENKATPLERLFLLDRLKNNIDFFQLGNESIDKCRNAIYRELTTAESFASLYTGRLSLHSISDIKRSTFNFGKSAQEQEIESLLTKLSKQLTNEETIDSLKLLQNKTLSFIRDQTLKYEPPPSYREIRLNPSLKKLNRLVSILETSTNELIQLQPEKQLILSQIKEKASLRDFAGKLNIRPEEKGDSSQKDVADIEVSIESSSDGKEEEAPEDLDDQLIKLQEKPSFHSNGIQYTYLGGRNNINWIGGHEGPDSSFQRVLRIEKAADTKYQLRHRIINTPDLKQHLAHDSFYCTMKVSDSRMTLSDIERANPNISPGDTIINLVVSEYCPRQNIGYAVHNEYEYEQSKFLAASNATQQVAEIANDFFQNDLVYTDIKAENFLLRADGKVITADIKSLRPTDQQGHMKLEGLAFTEAYRPPELRKTLGPIDAEAYMSYQTGLMYYMLLSGLTNRPNLTMKTEEQKKQLFEQLSEQGLDGLDFNTPIFQSEEGQLSEEGQRAKDLICACMNPDPSKRPSLEAIAKECKSIGDYLPAQKQLQEMRGRLFIPKDSNANMPSLSKAEGKEEAKIMSHPSSSSSSQIQAEMKETIRDLRKKETKDVEKDFESGPSCSPENK